MGSNLGYEVTPEFSRHMGGWTLAEKFDAGDAIEGLIAHPGWTVLLDLLDAERATVEKRLADTVEPPSRAQYAMAHGRLGGMRAVVEAAHTVLGKRDTALAQQKARHESEPLALAERG